MAKLKCKCGYVINDQTDHLKYKGYILPDIYVDDVSKTLTNSVETLIDALKKSKKRSWIKNSFSKGYPINIKESSMIHDLVSGKIINTVQNIFECENCGRIAIQVGQKNEYKFFLPDDDTKGILSGGTEIQN